MFNLREETIKTMIAELKITNSPFNVKIIEAFIEHITDAELKDFYMALFDVGAKEFNGMDRISKVSKSFKSVGEVYSIDKEAKEIEKEFSGHGTNLRKLADEKHVTYRSFAKGIKLKFKDERKALIYFEFGGSLEIISMNLQPTTEANVKRVKYAIIRADKTIDNKDLAIENKSIKRLKVK